ncbi:MAG: 2-oxo acid dehydrogenase subunit E2 [Caldisericia bacterium]|nr:2-oxo acid dehydrogenase subunit E2 [Caldisericia bacterium]
MYEVRMPKFGLTMETGFIEKWFKKEGEKVQKGEPLLEVSSEKITNEVASPVSGIVKKIIGEEGKEYKVGEVIALIEEEGEKEEKKEIAPPSRKGEERIKISPLARRIAKEMNIDLSKVKGSGPGGRIVKRDLLPFLSTSTSSGEVKIEKLSGLRKVISERLSKSFHTVVTVTNILEVDFTEFIKKVDEKNVSITSGLIFVVSNVLKKFKKFNAHFDGDSLKIYTHVNIGVAVDTEKGLIVPVIKNTHSLSLQEINNKLKEIASKARSESLKPEEIRDSTFTITNLGMMATDIFTPVINPPEVAILGVGRIKKGIRIFDNNTLSIRDIGFLSLSYDHRVIDGADAARFLKELENLIENPSF